MLSCINKNSVEFQTLKNKSGLTDFELEAYCRASIDKLGRFPYLDELPYSDSSEYLKKSIKNYYLTNFLLLVFFFRKKVRRNNRQRFTNN